MSKPLPLYEVINEKLVVRPHKGQIAALKSDKQIIAVLAGTQSGKSTLAPLWMYQEMQVWDRKVLAGEAVLDAAFMVVSTTHPLLERKLAPIYIDFFVDTLKIAEYHVQAKRLDVRIDRPDGTHANYDIFFGSAKNSESLASVTCAGMHLDEAGQQFFSRDAWHELEDRTGSTGGRILITTTIYNFDWLYDEVYLECMNGSSDIEVIHFDSIQNPFYSRKLWDKHKRTLPKALFDQRHRGRFTRSEGQIYDIFNEKIHTVTRFPIPSGTPQVVGIDPGTTNHATIRLARIDYGTELHTKMFPYATLHESVYVAFACDLTGSKGTTMTNTAHARLLRELPDFYDIRTIAGGAKSEIYFREDYAAEGVRVHKPPTHEVESGIEAVYQLLVENRLYIFQDLEDLIGEIRSYSRDMDERGNALLTIHNKSTYHRIDALRYIALYLDSVAVIKYVAPVSSVSAESHMG